MKYIANILTNRKFNDTELYNIVSKKEDLISDIPTLVIGWEFTKKMYPNANILDWKINDLIYWSFNNRERGQRYEETVIKFREYVIKNLVKNTKYKFINVLLNDNKEGLNYLLDNIENLKIYLNNDIIYITDHLGKWVYGYSLRQFEYLGIDRKIILHKIYKSNNKIINVNDDLSNEMKIALKNYSYVIPCLY
jgi:hypothetical protein